MLRATLPTSFQTRGAAAKKGVTEQKAVESTPRRQFASMGLVLIEEIALQNLHFWVPRQQNRKKWRARLLSIWSVTSGDPPFCPLPNRLRDSLFFITPTQQPTERTTTKTTTIQQQHNKRQEQSKNTLWSSIVARYKELVTSSTSDFVR